eukprot:CAMPEP_0195509728 /NCGR_PEP_ID=MMETSP0794_2-20130614/2585_1 /TAXON_ID=515487 /ORGANISM="Stephanopyxis turris, Strain CCMP 815" /LENGTH=880 /DNA_ID=CAMNT_0040637019 /DNA_START=160 /DNA_END=2802 /DNA_ORIENTATION=+
MASNPKPFQAAVTNRFLILSLITATLLAFTVGRAARIVFIEGPAKALIHPGITSTPGIFRPDVGKGGGLPPPKMRTPKDIPHTLYSSKNFDTAASHSAKTVLIDHSASEEAKNLQQTADKKWNDCAIDENGEVVDNSTCQVSPSIVEKYEDDEEEEGSGEEEDDAEHLPAGQHLLVDIKEVDGDFLNDEQALAQAMVDVVWESDLTLLSYHCHTLTPSGVSCVGVLLESHISFHTWPNEGVITLDLFTCGSGLLVPVVPTIERLFGIKDRKQGEHAEDPIMVWAHKLRGFRPENDASTKTLRLDVGKQILDLMDLDMKKQIASVETEYQKIDIWDVLDPKYTDLISYRRSLQNDDSYEATHPELFLPNRKVHLDGVLQSSRLGNEAYHEALVHPGMFAHPNPKRVAIIGGGEGATLREILKHNTLELVKMIEIDEGMVKTSREFLPDWSDCSDMVGSTQSCFDDLRADILNEDALAWFMDRFADGVEDGTEEKFDVIIMDALDPQDDIPFAEVLYSNDLFTKALSNALTDDGVMILQLGISPELSDPPDITTKSKNRAKITHGLKRIGFESMHSYDEAHCNFDDPWSYIVACKSYSCRQDWYQNQAEKDLAIHERILRTYSDKPALKYFDGATMKQYQVPPKVFEVNLCRHKEHPEECEYLLGGYSNEVTNIPMEAFEVKESSRGAFDKLGVFTKVDIPKGSMIVQEQTVHSAHFPPKTVKLMNSLMSKEPEASEELYNIQTYIDSYGFENALFGDSGYDVHSSILAFVNHGCNGLYNINSDSNFEMTEGNANPKEMPSAHYPKAYWKDVFNPVAERHLPHMIGDIDIALRDIKAGEELLDNYLTSVSTEENWAYIVDDLVALCEKQSSTSAATETSQEL